MGERVRNAEESECMGPSTRICEDLVNQLNRRRHLRLESCIHVRLPTITELLRCRHSCYWLHCDESVSSLSKVSISYFFGHYIGPLFNL